MEKIVLVGSGGHAKSVVDAIEALGIYEIVGFTDKLEHEKFIYRGYEVLGTDDCLEELFQKGVHRAFVCVGYLGKGTLRNRLYDQLKKIGFSLPVVIDPSAVLAKDVQVEEGTFVGKCAILNSNTRIGKMCIINTSAIIEHDCVIREFSHVAVGAVLCGNVTLGAGSMIGANSTVVQCVNLPDNTFIKSGSLQKG